MASYGYTLQEFINQHKPSNIDRILTFILNERKLFFLKLLKEPSDQFAFECEILQIIQKYLAKKKLPPVVFETEPTYKYTIQHILVKKYNEHYVIKLRVDRWLGDISDQVCEYVDQIYDIDEHNLDVTYRNSNQYKE